MTLYRAYVRRVFLKQLAVVPEGGELTELPSEFQLFWPGENASTKGSVWFDEVSALRVMADADTYANEYPIDLEHRMVRPRLVDPSNSDTDAMAWHRIEVRREAGGLGLWAVEVSWTPEGARRLRARSQRYTSPAFFVETDPATGRERVVKYENCALCARPATHDIPPLVASVSADAPSLDTRTDSGYGAGSMSKDRECMAAALASLDAGDAVSAQSQLRAALAEPEAAEGGEPAPSEGAPPAEPTDEEYTRARDEVIALAGEGVSDLPGALRALRKRACDVTGAADLAAGVGFMSSVLRERSEREAAELRALVTDLVRLNAETPATAWANNAPVPRLVAEGLPALRARVAALRDARPAALTPPASTAGTGEDALEDFERRDAAKIKDPEARARFVAGRLERKQKAQ